MRCPPSVIVSYEQIIIYWAKLLLRMERLEKVIILLNNIDIEKSVFTVERLYIDAIIKFKKGNYEDCRSSLRDLFREDPNHHEGLVLYGSIYFHDKLIVSKKESEAFISNAM